MGDARFMLTVAPGQPTDGQAAANGFPTSFALHPAYPNPFNPTATIRYDMATAGDVTIEIFDLLGRLVSSLVRAHMEAGTHSVRWDASLAASGFYVVRMRAGATHHSMQITLLR
jgi:hypothetical protein